LTAGLAETPHFLPLQEVRALLEKYPEIAPTFALALELSLQEAEQAPTMALPRGFDDGTLLGMIGRLKGADGRLDPEVARMLADGAKARGGYE
jgi:hypothetical protein